MADSQRTTCPYCGTGCGVMISPARDGWAVGGDPDHPANHGRLCSKGTALADMLDPAGRLTRPSVDGTEVPWRTAIDTAAARLTAVIDAHGPEAVAFYVSGQLLTEDYYVANKLIKGFIGSPHIDTNSRLCMASTVAGHKRAFGGDLVPGAYEDLDSADVIVLVGSNLAWCHPVLHKRVLAAQARGAKLVAIDPRRSASVDDADLHLPLKPGSDVTLFNGLLTHLAGQGALDHAYLAAHVDGASATLSLANDDAPDIATVAAACDLPEADLAAFYALFTATERVVSVFSQGVNQSRQGTDKVNAIINVHLATGRIGRPGMGPFSVTGQPNAMGGREVGGLANQLAAHMNPDDPEDVDRLRRFWRAPALKGGQGLKAVDLFRAIEAGRIKAVWIMGTNPAVSLPEAERVRTALARCPLVIVSDVVTTSDTLAYAHIRLPAAAWSEKSGTVTNSERRISRQRGFRPPPGDAKPDWWIICQLARALGHAKAFSFSGPAAIFREHAALSAFENHGRRGFDIGGLAGISNSAYDALAPIQWPVPHPAALRGTARLFTDGRFFTDNGRARMIPVRHQTPRALPSIAYPLIANTGRYRDQWHTMTRTGRSARLAAHRPEPLVEIHPQDGAAFDLADGGLARIESRHGRLVCRVAITDRQRPGTVFLPIHWTDLMAADAVVGRLVDGHVDPVSGQPESKHTPVRIMPLRPAWNGLLLTRRRPNLPALDYWCRHTLGTCHAYELADGSAQSATTLIGHLFRGRALERLDYGDAQAGIARHAWITGDRLEACLFVGPDRPVVARDWLAARFAGTALDEGERAFLLAGRAPGATPEKGRIVCACHGVGARQIAAACRSGQARTIADLGTALGAGTGCGSCIPELKEILHDALRDDSAAA